MTMEPVTEPTFVFEGEKVYAMVGGQVVAAADDVEELEADLAHDKEQKAKKEKPKKATHVITPNGVKGRILGGTKDIWGEEEVAVRLENGRIAHLKVADAGEFVSDEEDEEEKSPIDNLKKQVDSDEDEDPKDRKDKLEKIKAEARDLMIRGASLTDEEKLDEIVITADAEIDEINDHLEHQSDEEANAYRPPAPFHTEVVEQASMGGEGGQWLDKTLDEMVEEANSYDYENLMDEGPEAFVAELDEGVLDQPEAVQAIAANYIRSKTAAAEPIVREKYESVWLARVDDVRKTAAEAKRTDTKKEAAHKDETWVNAPDESLFD